MSNERTREEKIYLCQGRRKVLVAMEVTRTKIEKIAEQFGIRNLIDYYKIVEVIKGEV